MAANTENNNVLQDRWPEKKEEELSLRTDVEKVILYFQGKLPHAKLSPAMEEKISRLKRTAELINKYGGAKKVIPIVEELFGISFSSARRLYIEAQDAFGGATYFNRQYHIDNYIQMIITGANQARDTGDYRSYSSLMKEYKEAIKEFMGTSDADMYRQLQVPAFQVGFFPEELKTKLPANWKSRLEKLKEAKRKDEIEDAIVLEPELDEEDPL
jgi:hypothetical protein